MKLQTQSLLTAATACAALATGSANAATVLIDWSAVNDISGIADANGNFWNSLGAGGTGSDLSATPLVDVNNDASGFTVAVDNTGVTSNFTGAGFGGTGVNGPTGPNPFDATGSNRPTIDGIFANYNANGTSVISFSNLSSSTQYDFSAIGGRASGGSDGTIEVLLGTSGSSTYTLSKDGTVLNFSVTSTAGGFIQFGFSEIEDDIVGSTGAGWNALSITEVPEPGSLALLGLGGLLVASRRRRD